MANMINNLAVGVAHSTLLYGEIGMELGWHYKNSWNHRWTILKQVYFYNLWRRTVTVATFIVVIRTVLQTVEDLMEVGASIRTRLGIRSRPGDKWGSLLCGVAISEKHYKNSL
ncbi:hypothetical protein SCA6_015381 [Theobroma cacao]